jgi:hypothetical protein
VRSLDPTYCAREVRQEGLLLAALVCPVPVHKTVTTVPSSSVPHLAVGLWVATFFVLFAGPKKIGSEDLFRAYGVCMPAFGWL